MKKLLKVLAAIAGALVLLAGGFALYVQIDGIPHYAPPKVDLHVEATPARVARGKKLVTTLCAECHKDPTTQKLTGQRMLDAPPELGIPYSRNITKHPTKGIGGWTDGELAVLLRTGIARDGRYTPPWMVKLPLLADEDIASIIAFLRSDDPLVAPADVENRESQPTFLVKFLSHVAWKPLPYPTAPIPMPDPKDPVAIGRYYVDGLGCFACHSADFKKMDEMHPERSAGYLGGGNMLLDVTGRKVWSKNITPDDETGIGKWTAQDFRRAMKEGFRPDGAPISYPMPRIPELTDEESDAIYAYLRTVPKIRNVVPPREAPPDDAGGMPLSDGKKIYNRYACSACHGDTGVGNCDLRGASAKYDTNEKLTAFIKKPVAVVPDTKMPSWEGVIKDEEYGPLCDYVRQLGGAQAATKR